MFEYKKIDENIRKFYQMPFWIEGLQKFNRKTIFGMSSAQMNTYKI